MTDIRSEADLQTIMERAARNAINSATKEILSLFREEYIMKYVYQSHDPNKRYHADTRKPTYEFKNAWDWTGIEKRINMLVTELWYNSSNMDYSEKTMKHGSKYSSPNDVTGNLADILNKRGLSSSLWLSVNREPYWDIFIEKVFSGGELDRILSRHFAANGFIKT